MLTFDLLIKDWQRSWQFLLEIVFYVVYLESVNDELCLLFRQEFSEQKQSKFKSNVAVQSFLILAFVDKMHNQLLMLLH